MKRSVELHGDDHTKTKLGHHGTGTRVLSVCTAHKEVYALYRETRDMDVHNERSWSSGFHFSGTPGS